MIRIDTTVQKNPEAICKLKFIVGEMVIMFPLHFVLILQ